MAFTCSRCGRTSHCPGDARQGYCGSCHDFTGRGDVFECGQCGTRSVVPLLHAGAVWCPCGTPEPMHEFRPSDTRLADSHGLWQYIGHTDSGLRLAESREVTGPPDIGAVARYIEERYTAVPVPVPAAPAALAELAAHPDAPWQCEASSMDFGYLRDLVRVANLAISASLEVSGQNSPGEITGDPEREAASRQDEVDDIPWSNYMRWLPGCSEL